MRSFTALSALGWLISSSSALPTAQGHSVSLPLSSHVVYQFPEDTWIENLAVRSNGDLLLTHITAPQLYSVNPLSTNTSAELVYEFPGSTALFGITEMEHDIFYVLSANYTTTAHFTNPGSYILWRVDLNNATPDVSIVTYIPEGIELNGLTPIGTPETAGVLLIADSGKAAVFRVDVNTGEYSDFWDFPELNYPANASLAIGVNGIHAQGNYVYWTNSELATLSRVEIDCDGNAVSPVETLADNIPGLPDDFTLDAKGDAWVTLDLGSELGFIKAGQNSTTVVLGSSDQLILPGPTAAQFGRTSHDKHILYVSTNGGLASPINGTLTEGGKVVAVDTRGFRSL